MRANKLVVKEQFPLAACDVYYRRQLGEWQRYYQVRQRDLIISYETLAEESAWQNAADRIQFGDFS